MCLEVHVVIYVEIFILSIREPLANTGQLCTTTSYSDTSANEDNSLAEIFISRNVISRRFL